MTKLTFRIIIQHWNKNKYYPVTPIARKNVETYLQQNLKQDVKMLFDIDINFKVTIEENNFVTINFNQYVDPVDISGIESLICTKYDFGQTSDGNILLKI